MEPGTNQGGGWGCGRGVAGVGLRGVGLGGGGAGLLNVIAGRPLDRVFKAKRLPVSMHLVCQASETKLSRNVSVGSSKVRGCWTPLKNLSAWIVAFRM